MNTPLRRNSLIFFYLLYIVILISASLISAAQTIVRNVYLDQKELTEADRFGNGFPFLSNIGNQFHVPTKRYVVEDEFIFWNGEELFERDIEETLENLRQLKIFSKIRIDVDTIDSRSVDVYVETRDRQTALLSPAIDIGGGIAALGGLFHEENFIGTSSSLIMKGVYRTENDIGWSGMLFFRGRQIFRSGLNAEGSIESHRFRTNQSFLLEKPFHSIFSNTSFRIGLKRSFGSDFVYKMNSAKRIPYMSEQAEAQITFGFLRKDRIFFSMYASVDNTERADALYRQPFDNSGRILFAFSSLSRQQNDAKVFEGSGLEDNLRGGWGSAVLGKSFAIGSKGESMYYIGGKIQQSRKFDKVYVFGQLSAGSGFSQARPFYTYQEFLGIGHYIFSSSTVFVVRVRQQTAWNWGLAFRQLVLDNDAGLRGYSANAMVGDNRIIANSEFRYFPNAIFWQVRLSVAAFHDIGTIWSRDTPILKAQTLHSLGGGFRLHSVHSSNNEALLRVDFCYNSLKNNFGGIVVSGSQSFSLFGSHTIEPPQIFGLNIDRE